MFLHSILGTPERVSAKILPHRCPARCGDELLSDGEGQVCKDQWCSRAGGGCQRTPGIASDTVTRNGYSTDLY